MQLPHNSLYDRRENDFYATRDLRAVASLKLVLNSQSIPVTGTVADMCCGEGHILKHFENSNRVYGADIVDRGYKHQLETIDLLKRTQFPVDVKTHISNLPYERNLVNQLTQKLIDLTKEAEGTLCLLFRHQFAAGFDKARQNLFDTPHFVGEFKLPFRPYFELPVYLWGKDATPSPQHPYAWYVWNYSKEWAGITRYAPRVEDISKFSDEDLDLAKHIDATGQELLADQLSEYGESYLNHFSRLRGGDNIMSSNQSWYFCSDGEKMDDQFAKCLLGNRGKARNKHLGTLKPLNDGLPLLDAPQTYKWCL